MLIDACDIIACIAKVMKFPTLLFGTKTDIQSDQDSHGTMKALAILLSNCGQRQSISKAEGYLTAQQSGSMGRYANDSVYDVPTLLLLGSYCLFPCLMCTFYFQYLLILYKSKCPEWRHIPCSFKSHIYIWYSHVVLKNAWTTNEPHKSLHVLLSNHQANYMFKPLEIFQCWSGHSTLLFTSKWYAKFTCHL